jgi:hypothetical protein
MRCLFIHGSQYNLEHFGVRYLPTIGIPKAILQQMAIKIVGSVDETNIVYRCDLYEEGPNNHPQYSVQAEDGRSTTDFVIYLDQTDASSSNDPARECSVSNGELLRSGMTNGMIWALAMVRSQATFTTPTIIYTNQGEDIRLEMR